MSKKPANNNLSSLQELQQLQRNLPKLPDSMDPQKKRLIYGLLAVFAVIVLIIGLVYVSKNGVDGLLERASKAGYSRDQFGPAWDDVDGNKCNTRDDILRRDLTNVRFKVRTHACTVISGTLNDPYTGKTIEFKRGKKTSSAVQIDHVVALSNAWQTGAQDLTAEQRRQLANDPENLLAADGPANQQKSDADAADWLPSNTAYRCTYVARQVHVKAKYKLWFTADEKKVMERVLNSCKDTNPTKK